MVQERANGGGHIVIRSRFRDTWCMGQMIRINVIPTVVLCQGITSYPHCHALGQGKWCRDTWWRRTRCLSPLTCVEPLGKSHIHPDKKFPKTCSDQLVPPPLQPLWLTAASWLVDRQRESKGLAFLFFTPRICRVKTHACAIYNKIIEDRSHMSFS